ncbi:MAG: UPF0175 family protein [Candidatus Woesearchaeota archaeon]
MSKSTTLSFTVPNELKLKLDAITHIGYYDSLSEFLRDAIRNLLNQNKNIRIAIAFELYKTKKISLPKAAEIINDSLEETEKLLKERDI